MREANRVLVENLAATSIQKMYRGFTCRRMNEQRQRETELRAAVRIQSTWKGREQRMRNEEARVRPPPSRAGLECRVETRVQFYGGDYRSL